MPRAPDPLDPRLAALDRDQLEALVRRLVSREPDLEDLVHLPLPGERQRADGRHMAAQVSRILLTMGDDWRASSRAERELWPLVEIGTQYLDQGAPDDARTVFVAISITILRHYEQIRDEESEVAGIVGQCVEGLGRCLAVATSAAEREALLRDVFAVYRWDALDHGGYGMDDAPRRVLLGEATPEERSTIATWVREAMPRGSANHGRWRRQHGGRFVLELVGRELDDAGREALFAEADLDGARLDLLLAQGRELEAVRMVRDAASDSLVGLADKLVAAGLLDAARSAVRDHLSVLEPDNHRVRDWLVKHGVPLPANVDALVEAVRWFQLRPNIRSYQDLRREAGDAGRWPAVLGLVGNVDPQRKNLQPVRARIRADLGDSAGALAELEGLTGSSWKSAVADVAGSLAATHPGVAAELYRTLIDALVAHGTKAAGKQAAEVRLRLAALETRHG